MNVFTYTDNKNTLVMWSTCIVYSYSRKNVPNLCFVSVTHEFDGDIPTTSHTRVCLGGGYIFYNNMYGWQDGGSLCNSYTQVVSPPTQPTNKK